MPACDAVKMGVGAMDCANAGIVQLSPFAFGTTTAPLTACPFTVPDQLGRKSAVLYAVSFSGGCNSYRRPKFSVRLGVIFQSSCAKTAYEYPKPFMAGLFTCDKTV